MDVATRLHRSEKVVLMSVLNNFDFFFKVGVMHFHYFPQTFLVLIAGMV